jgi:hypothetical protein
MEQSSHFPNEVKDAVPEAERRPILLRAYADVPYEKHQSKGPVTSPSLLGAAVEPIIQEILKLLLLRINMQR